MIQVFPNANAGIESNRIYAKTFVVCNILETLLFSRLNERNVSLVTIYAVI